MALGAARAWADPVELTYRAPAACPSRAAIEDAIRARMPPVKFAAHASRVFAISISASGDGFAGTLAVDGAEDQPLSAHRCDDLVEALALVTAIAIDPEAAITTPRPRRPHAPRWDLFALGAGELGIAPRAMPGGGVGARVRFGAWDVGVEGLAGLRSQREDEGGRARFLWLSARPSACWVAVHAGRFDAAACGDVEVGAVRASGEDIVNGRDLWRLWLAAGASARGRVALSPRFFAQIEVGGAVPLERDTYLFAPGTTIHQTAAVTGWGTVGLGLRL
ncbi:MAG TPA: hypothetical protein VGM88_20515 [Kofleriaceae bacterium]